MPRLLKAALATLLLAAVIFVAGVPALVRTEWARGRIEGAIERRLDRKAELGTINFSWWDGLAATSFVIHQRDADDEKRGPLFRAKELRFDVGFVELLSRKLEIDRLVAVDPTVVIVRDERGRFNIADLMEDSGGNVPPVEVGFESRGGRVVFEDRRNNSVIDASKLEVEGHMRDRRLSFEASFALKGGAGHAKGGIDFSKKISTFEFSDVALDGAELDAELSSLGLFVPLFGEKAKQLDGKVRIDLKNLRGSGFDLGSLKSSLNGRGTIEATAGTIVSGPVFELWDAAQALLARDPTTLAAIFGKRLMGRQQARETKVTFDAIRSHFVIRRGRIASEDLRVAAKDVSLAFMGSTSFTGALDWDIMLETTHRALDGLTMHLGGTLASPRVAVDVKAAAQKKAEELLRERAEREGEKIRERAEREAEKIRERVEREVQKHLPVLPPFPPAPPGG